MGVGQSLEFLRCTTDSISTCIHKHYCGWVVVKNSEKGGRVIFCGQFGESEIFYKFTPRTLGMRHHTLRLDTLKQQRAHHQFDIGQMRQRPCAVRGDLQMCAAQSSSEASVYARGKRRRRDESVWDWRIGKLRFSFSSTAGAQYVSVWCKNKREY